MSVQVDDSGRRGVQVEVEVPGSVVSAWRAIATGTGISSWFVPTVVDEKVDGEVRASFGPGMDSVATIKKWNPLHSFVCDSADLGPDAPIVETKWEVEERSEALSVVRVHHSVETESADWDNHLQAWEGGWPDFFRILSLYLAHFDGQPCSLLQVSTLTKRPRPDVWANLCDGLGVAGIKVNERRRLEVEGLPAFDVDVERRGMPPHEEELLMRTSEPMPGLTHWFAMDMGKETMLSLRFYVYGDAARDAALAIEPRWQAWIDKNIG